MKKPLIYDVAILGGGPGGYHAAILATQNGLRTVLIEKNELGGVCVNEGCIPTKQYLHSVRLYEQIKQCEREGVLAENVVLKHELVREKKDKIVRQIVSGISMQLKSSGVEVIKKKGRITGEEDGNYRIEAGERILTAKHIILATGAKVFFPNIKGLEDGLQRKFVITSKELLSLDKVPKKLVIVGGGVIAMEMASYYHALGAETTIIESTDHILGNIGHVLSNKMYKHFSAIGMRIHLSSVVTEIYQNLVVYKKMNKKYAVEADKIVICTGRIPDYAELGLERVKLNTQSRIISVDETCQTSRKGIFIIGDANGKSMLAHTAYREAEVCVNTILGITDAIHYSEVPSVIFTYPEVAVIGETEDSAKEKGLEVTTKIIELAYSGKYQIEHGKDDGYLQLLIENKEKRIIGIAICCAGAGELISNGSFILHNKMTIEEVQKVIFPHPTVSEIFHDAVYKI